VFVQEEATTRRDQRLTEPFPSASWYPGLQAGGGRWDPVSVLRRAASFVQACAASDAQVKDAARRDATG